MLKDILDIPVDLEGKVPCQDIATRGLFHTLDLDVDIDDPDYLALTTEGKQARHAAKAVAEQAAIEACSLCPIMQQCREWAMRVHVHGVAGGLTEKERYGRPSPEEIDTARGARNSIPEILVRDWTEEGHSAETIANRLDCSIRTVERARNRSQTIPGSPHSLASHKPVDSTIKARVPRGHKPAPKSAKTALDFSNLTPESLAMYEFLASRGTPVNRKEVAQYVARFVAPETALKWGERLPCIEEKKPIQGALKLARNRIDIAFRHGRIARLKQDGETLLSLPHDVKNDYLAWCEQQESATTA